MSVVCRFKTTMNKRQIRLHMNNITSNYMINKRLVIEHKVHIITFSSSTFCFDKIGGPFNLTMVLDNMHCANRIIILLFNNPQEWIVPQFLNLRPKMAKSIVYVITLITNRNHAFHCLN